MEPLKKTKNFKGPDGPVVLAILDGVGIGTCKEGDVVSRANTPTLDWLAHNALCTRLKAHGTAVGMPTDGDMGNSEIGHNAIGCGRVFAQGAKLVNESIENRELFQADVWKEFNIIGSTSLDKSRINEFSLYPNPVIDVLKIDGLKPGTDISVYNMNGIMVQNLIAKYKIEKIDFSTLPIGEYIVKAKFNNVIKIKKVIRN